MIKITDSIYEYEKELLEQIKAEQRPCNYSDCNKSATSLFYINGWDLHFFYCNEHSAIIEIGGYKEAQITIDVKAEEMNFQITKEGTKQ